MDATAPSPAIAQGGQDLWPCAVPASAGRRRVEDLPIEERLRRLENLMPYLERTLGRRLPAGQKLWFGCEVRACFGLSYGEARNDPHRAILMSRCHDLPADPDWAQATKDA